MSWMGLVTNVTSEATCCVHFSAFSNHSAVSQHAPSFRSLSYSALLMALTACADAPVQPGDPTPADSAGLYAGEQSVARFQLLGGFRLNVAYPGEGLALLRDSDGFVVEAVAGAHVHTASVHLYDLRGTIGTGGDPDQYPLLNPLHTWSVAELFPRWISGQSLRDMTAVGTASSFDLAGIGRVFYNTSPRATTQINVRSITRTASAVTFGAAREVPIDLPEQEFSGFIKHSDPERDLGAIGAGAYDSGQGSVAGLSYAVRQSDGRWTRLLTPPPFGDLTSPRLPRDNNYSCVDGRSWVCIPASGDTGVWSTERIGGGGVRYGNNILFIATLGYGPRSYARQSYTFGDPSQDQAVAYFFVQDPVTNVVSFRRYDRWTFAAPGQNVLGTALGRMRGSNDLLLFVVKTNAWGSGRDGLGTTLQIFRIEPS